ncbi:hypothetical protein B0H14DRAFT_2229919, partial [Mycena olivaceomarginata]
YADAAQQAFSSDEGPSMHLTVSALESLHRGWETQVNKLARVEFEPALTAGINKIAEYYDKVTDSNAYIFCMLLDPSRKLRYWGKHWSAELQAGVL